MSPKPQRLTTLRVSHILILSVVAFVSFTWAGCTVGDHNVRNHDDSEAVYDAIVSKWLGYSPSVTTIEEINGKFRNVVGANLEREAFYEALAVYIKSAPKELKITLDQANNRLTVALPKYRGRRLYDMFFFEFDGNEVFRKVRPVRVSAVGDPKEPS